MVDFTEVMSPLQRQWLAQTLQPVRTSTCHDICPTRRSFDAQQICSSARTVAGVLSSRRCALWMRLSALMRWQAGLRQSPV